MKRYILNITTLVVAIFSANIAWGQNNGTLPDPNELNEDLSTGTYILTKNYKPGDQKRWRVSSGRNVTVDLNGHTIDGVNINRTIFNISNGTLTIIDSKGGGKIINSKKSCFYVAPSGSNKSTLNFQGGTIENCSPSDGNGGAMDIQPNGTVNMSGGTITGCKGTSGAAVYVIGGTFNMTGGEIKDNKVNAYKNWTPPTGEEDIPSSNNTSTSRGGGIYVEKGKCNVSGGTISGNVAHSGGGVFVTSGATFNFTGGTISGNYAVAKLGQGTGNGGGIYIEGGNSNCTINGGTISNNRATRYGGGININGSTITIPNCTISANLASSGGGISMETTGSTLNLQGCTLNGNIAKVSGSDPQGNNGGGGGIFINNGTINMSDKNSIYENRSRVFGGGIFVKQGKIIIKGNTQLNKNHSETSNGGGIYMTNGTLTINNGYTLTANENSAYDGGVIYMAEGNITVNGTFNAGTKNLSNTATRNGGVIALAGGNLTINNGKLLYNTAKRAGAIHMNGGSLTINGTVDIGNNEATQYAGGAIFIADNNAASFTINGTVNLNNNKTTTKGGGIYMANGILKVNTSKTLSVNGNSAENGGAIYLAAGSINVDGTFGAGTSSSNTATQSGGAIYMEQGNFSVNGDITMNENQAGANGGALYLGGGNVNASSGVATIQSNTADDNGGAIYVGSGSVTLQKTTISGNRSGNGGAIYAKGNVTINDEATISTNTATDNGGAIYVEDGNLTTKKVTASGNSAANGGVFFVKGGNVNLGVTVSGQTVTQVAAAEMTSNTVTGNGGAIALENGVFTMHNDSKISLNSAGGYGGALYIKNEAATSITCKGGTFSQNTAKAGGAVCADGPITLALAANIENNTAQVGGGIYLVNGVNMTFGDASQPLGLIRANKAEGTTILGTAKGMNAETVSGVGGGIFMADGTTLTFANAKELGIYNNSASFAGADICANGTNTLITLPETSKMNLTGFDVPGNMLYWAEDFANGDTGYTEGTGIRYVDELRAQSPNVKHFSADSTHVVDKYACLDLGYDLVFVKIKNIGLQLNDDCAVTISYDKVQTDANGEVIMDGNGNPTYVLTEYRKILFSGKGTANDNNNSVYDTEIGLPSNDSWKFKVTQWSYKYDVVEFSPGDQKRQDNALATDPDAIYGISKEGIKCNNVNYSDRLITIKHILQKDGINIGDFNTRVVNKMIPGGSSSN